MLKHLDYHLNLRTDNLHLLEIVENVVDDQLQLQRYWIIREDWEYTRIMFNRQIMIPRRGQGRLIAVPNDKISQPLTPEDYHYFLVRPYDNFMLTGPFGIWEHAADEEPVIQPTTKDQQIQQWLSDTAIRLGKTLVEDVNIEMLIRSDVLEELFNNVADINRCLYFDYPSLTENDIIDLCDKFTDLYQSLFKSLPRQSQQKGKTHA